MMMKAEEAQADYARPGLALVQNGWRSPARRNVNKHGKLASLPSCVMINNAHLGLRAPDPFTSLPVCLDFSRKYLHSAVPLALLSSDRRRPSFREV